MTTERRILTRLLGVVAGLLLLVMAVSAGAAREPFAPTGPTETMAWAVDVVDFKVGSGTVGVNFSDPANALGPVDSISVSLGNAVVPAARPPDPTACEAFLIVSFGDHALIDGEGDDLILYEAAVGSLLEPTWVYIKGANTDWRFVGESAGGRDPMDISAVADPSESFDQVGICDIPDGDTTIAPAPGPDIDAVVANNTVRLGLVAQAQGPGWSIELDPGPVARNANAFAPMPTLQDIGFFPPAVLLFECPDSEPLQSCTSLLTIRALCGIAPSTSPLYYLYPFLPVTLNDLAPPVSLRELLTGFREVRYREFGIYCDGRGSRTIDNDQESIAVMTLDQGGLRYVVVDEAWRFTLQTPAASVHSAGANHFIAVHYPHSGTSTVRVIGGTVEVDPAAPGEGPLTVTAGQQVVITPDGPQPLIELDIIFLPGLMR